MNILYKIKLIGINFIFKKIINNNLPDGFY